MNNYNTNDLYKFYCENGGTLSYKAYKNIIAAFHKAISEKIMNGYICILPHHLGSYKIVRQKRRISIKENGNIQGSINWGASNKLKQEIIDRGDIPLECIKDDKFNIISTNNGIPWLVYFTDEFYYKWIRVVNVFLHNYAKYTFTPTWTNIRALASSINENTELTFNKGDRNAKHQERFDKSTSAKNECNVWNQ